MTAQAAPWQPPPGHAQVPIWPGAPPDARPASGPEDEVTRSETLVAGAPWHAVSDVVRPTLTVFPPKGAGTGAAVVVFPGGGYRVLAIDLEGTEVCDWLTSVGVTCVLLKYRVPGSGPHWDPARHRHVTPKAPTALQDAQRALSLVRHHAAEWHVDPQKVGVLGFSAGGHLVAAVSTHAARAYRAVDAADAERFRPDFAIALYSGHLWDEPRFRLAPDIRVTPGTPPTFLLHAQDDPVDDVNHSLVYYRALKEAGVPVEMHLYASGGHAFGLRRAASPITGWPGLVEAWLRTIGARP
jgi:acetyl esterase/lipase